MSIAGDVARASSVSGRLSGGDVEVPIVAGHERRVGVTRNDASGGRGGALPARWRRGVAVALTPFVAFVMALKSPQVPRWARAAVWGSLAYLLLPFDVIPDLTPFLGYADDLGVLGAAILVVVSRITPEIRAGARDRAARWLGVELRPED